jgi:hypothetical protein
MNVYIFCLKQPFSNVVIFFSVRQVSIQELDERFGTYLDLVLTMIPLVSRPPFFRHITWTNAKNLEQGLVF